MVQSKAGKSLGHGGVLYRVVVGWILQTLRRVAVLYTSQEQSLSTYIERFRSKLYLRIRYWALTGIDPEVASD